MEIKTKYELGQEVYFLDRKKAGYLPTGYLPGKGRITEIECRITDGVVPRFVYEVVDKNGYKHYTYNNNTFSSLAEFKQSVIQELEESWKDMEENKNSPF